MDLEVVIEAEVVMENETEMGMGENETEMGMVENEVEMVMVEIEVVMVVVDLIDVPVEDIVHGHIEKHGHHHLFLMLSKIIIVDVLNCVTVILF